jgi:Zn-dependent peptidase ImmA (M78 family)/DNA-binding XRE family transcriptional regulator
MSDTKTWVARAIRDAREQNGWSQGELAKRLGRTQTSVSYWESGKRSPGLDDVVELAGVLGRDAADFLPPAQARRPVRAVLRSTAERLAIGDVDQAIDRLLEQADQRVMPPARIQVRSQQPSNAANELLAAAEIPGPPVDVVRLAELCGALVLYEPFPPELSGLVFAEGGGAVIGINAEHFEVRQRFSIAHELGHLLFGHHRTGAAQQFHIDINVDQGAPPDYDWREERAANDFAAELLMPRKFVADLHRPGMDPRDLAREFRVSQVAMSYRLANLGLS